MTIRDSLLGLIFDFAFISVIVEKDISWPFSETKYILTSQTIRSQSMALIRLKRHYFSLPMGRPVL